MRHVKPVQKCLAVGLLIVAAACTSNDDPISPLEPTPSVTDAFTGALNTNGAVTEPFSVAASGTVTAWYSKLEPDATVVIGLSLGTWNGTACQTIIAIDKATQGTTVTGQADRAGRLCVRMYDAGGTLTEPTTYEVTVVHP